MVSRSSLLWLNKPIKCQFWVTFWSGPPGYYWAIYAGGLYNRVVEYNLVGFILITMILMGGHLRALQSMRPPPCVGKQSKVSSIWRLSSAHKVEHKHKYLRCVWDTIQMQPVKVVSIWEVSCDKTAEGVKYLRSVLHTKQMHCHIQSIQYLQHKSQQFMRSLFIMMK